MDGRLSNPVQNWCTRAACCWLIRLTHLRSVVAGGGGERDSFCIIPSWVGLAGGLGEGNGTDTFPLQRGPAVPCTQHPSWLQADKGTGDPLWGQSCPSCSWDGHKHLR